MPNDSPVVSAFADFLRRILVLPIATDDRIPGYPLPIDPKFREGVTVEWKKYPFPNEYRADVALDKASADIYFTWPNDPGPEGDEYQRKTVAYNLAKWYLQVSGMIRAPFEIELEPPVLQGQSPTILFESNHNGWGQCRVFSD